MAAALDAIAASVSVALIVVGARSLRLRRVVGPARRRTSNWKQQGLNQLALGVFFLSIYGPGVFEVSGWPRVWFVLAGTLVSLGLMAPSAFDEYWAWDEARRSNNRS